MKEAQRPLQDCYAADEAATRKIGAELAPLLSIGDVVLLDGPLGAGKTTLVRGLLQGLDYEGPVRSPTFNIVQTFDTDPPVLHADLYRVSSHTGLGIEDFLETRLCLIEWPDRAVGLVDPRSAWNVSIRFEDEGRRIVIQPPHKA